MKKNILIILCIILVLVVAGLITSYKDSARVRAGIEPKCVVKIISNDGSKVTYWGLGYKVIRYVNVSPNEPYESNRGVKYGNWFMKYELDNEPVNDNETEMQGETFKDFKLEFYSKNNSEINDILKLDEYIVRTFGGDVNVILDNGKVYTLKDALEKNIITAEQIVDKAKRDATEGNITADMYKEGGSMEYYYDSYTVLKLNSILWYGIDKDLVIGYAGPILGKYFEAKGNI